MDFIRVASVIGAIILLSSCTRETEIVGTYSGQDEGIPLRLDIGTTGDGIVTGVFTSGGKIKNAVLKSNKPDLFTSRKYFFEVGDGICKKKFAVDIQSGGSHLSLYPTDPTDCPDLKKGFAFSLVKKIESPPQVIKGPGVR